MSDQGNIFFTYENLAFSLPLITVIATYLFFQYVPLPVAGILIFGVVSIYQIRKQMALIRERKLQNLDEKAVRELVGDDDDNNDGGVAGTEKSNGKHQQQKAKNKIQQRLAQERKAEARKANASAAAKKNKGGKAKDDDDVDDDDLLMFAKGSRQTKSKKQ